MILAVLLAASLLAPPADNFTVNRFAVPQETIPLPGGYFRGPQAFCDGVVWSAYVMQRARGGPDTSTNVYAHTDHGDLVCHHDGKPPELTPLTPPK